MRDEGGAERSDQDMVKDNDSKDKDKVEGKDEVDGNLDDRLGLKAWDPHTLQKAAQKSALIRRWKKDHDSKGMDSTGMDSTGMDSKGMDIKSKDSKGMDSKGMDSKFKDETWGSKGDKGIGSTCDKGKGDTGKDAGQGKDSKGSDLKAPPDSSSPDSENTFSLPDCWKSTFPGSQPDDSD